MSSPVVVRSCCRVDLAGGTLDIWPLGLLHHGARTVNVAIDLPVEVSLAGNPAGRWAVSQGETRVAEADDPRGLVADPEGALVGQVAWALDLPPVHVRLASGSPRGGGLGASSALMVALIRAAEELTGSPARTPAEVVRLARDLEARMMGLPTGLQDHYPPLLGGVLDISYRPGGETVERIDVDLQSLGDAMIVAYSGRSHFSAGSNWEVIRRRLDGQDRALIGLFDRLVEAAGAMAAALAAGDLPAAGRALGDEWSARRQLAPGVSTPTVERMLDAAVAAGAWGGKVCGAGGGGSVVVLAPPERRSAVTEALGTAGGEVLTTRPTATGFQVVDRPSSQTP